MGYGTAAGNKRGSGRRGQGRGGLFFLLLLELLGLSLLRFLDALAYKAEMLRFRILVRFRFLPVSDVSMALFYIDGEVSEFNVFRKTVWLPGCNYWLSPIAILFSSH